MKTVVTVLSPGFGRPNRWEGDLPLLHAGILLGIPGWVTTRVTEVNLKIDEQGKQKQYVIATKPVP